MIKLSYKLFILISFTAIALYPFLTPNICLSYHPRLKSYVETRRGNITLQMDESTCGVAAAHFLASLFAVQSTQEEIMQIVLEVLYERNIDPKSGITLSAISITLDRLGLKNTGYFLSSSDLINYMKSFRLPVLAHQSHPTNHYVVLLGFLDNNLILADPSWGYRLLTTDQFYQMWSGVVLLPIPNQQQAKHAVDRISSIWTSWNLHIHTLYGLTHHIAASPLYIP